MANVTVTFWGICTYLRAFHRFVLVNASQGIIDRNPHLAGKGITAHHARLHLHAEDIVAIGALRPDELPGGMLVFNLDMVELTFTNPDLPAAVDAAGNLCAPDLDHYANGELGPLSNDAIKGGPSIAASFQVSAGTLQSFRRDKKSGACVNVLQCETVGDPILSITAVGDGASSTITLRSGASVLLTNLPRTPGDDKEVDFLLHFLAGESFPSDPKHPRGDDYCDCHVQTGLEDGGIEQYVGPGCSNTNWP